MDRPEALDTLGRPTITLRYRLRDDDDWRERQVELEAFFGGGAEHPEDLFHDVDWVPQHAAVSLLDDIETTDVAVTELTFAGSEGEKLTIKETFWNHGRSRVIEIMQQLDEHAEPYWEVIVDLRREAGETYELIRLGRDRGAVVPIHHAVTHARPDGSKQDVTLFPSR
jgi:hypothetical protein